MYRYGIVGNCQTSALISSDGAVDWLCVPRPDSPPVFGGLLDPEGGRFSISSASPGSATTRQYYVENTNILVTEVTDADGGTFRITDFCPRFEQYGRMYRPIALYRILEPVSGAPVARVSCRPVEGWDRTPAKPVRGNSHFRYEVQGDSLRLTTSMPLTHLSEEIPFPVREKTYFALTWGSGVEEDLAVVAERFLLQTRAYWQTWVKHCSIPTLFQAETIRSALALKLHCYEDTGAILAATTTSLPEEFGGQRNWDYRFCWLRDAHFTLSAFHSIGHFEEMEGFLKFLLGIVRARTGAGKSLAPVYNLGGRLPLPEQEHPAWAGYLGNAPVRTNNQAAEHVQNDVYGEMVLTLAPIFFDERFLHLRTPEHEELLEELAVLCHESISRPDAGLWEVRNGWKEHSFTNLMCWAGLERITRIRAQGWLRRLPFDPSQARDLAAAALAAGAQEGVLRNGPSDPSLDASLALGAILRIGDREIALRTVQEVRQKLALGADGEAASFFYRYNRPDDFGTPGSAFVICSFWVAQALAQLGEKEEARRILAHATGAANHVGLYSEHFDPRRRLQLGNFPQAYSHVGLINAAFAASPAWSEVL